eukprot:3598059-Rhodomonas_salina.2
MELIAEGESVHLTEFESPAPPIPSAPCEGPEACLYVSGRGVWIPEQPERFVGLIEQQRFVAVAVAAHAVVSEEPPNAAASACSPCPLFCAAVQTWSTHSEDGQRSRAACRALLAAQRH